MSHRHRASEQIIAACVGFAAVIIAYLAFTADDPRTPRKSVMDDAPVETPSDE